MYSTTVTVQDLAAVNITAVHFPGGTENVQRKSAPLGVVTHAPGATFARAAYEWALEKLDHEPTDIELDYAAAHRFDPAVYQPNWLIGVSGTAFQLQEDFRRTQHAGMLGSGCPGGNIYEDDSWMQWARPLERGTLGPWRKHNRPGKTVYDYWVAAFPGALTPVEVFPWRKLPNAAIGVDLLSDPREDKPYYNDAQRETYRALVRVLANTHGFPVQPDRVTTHTLASPCERGTLVSRGKVLGIHWDPPAKHWDHAAILASI